MRAARVDRLPMSGPADVSAIAVLLRSGDIAAGNIVAILDKTECNGCVNDFTRGYVVQTLRAVLTEYFSPTQFDRVSTVMSRRH